ncbi:cytochrome b5 domain-containing protein [Heliorestis acidaminivorans]|uniref:cytochrome b5 domain-containing protein n=1 Tax=Heliorestis acidaminivorans TaxID=553427 RepID=UPI0014781099|nr:cytochrome b5 domain-containing protein [Heliorestis acidaminivorans]
MWKKFFRQARKRLKSQEITLSLTELAQYDGKAGRRAYVAVDNVIYDVTEEATWEGATHFRLLAGRDLTEPFGRCHSGRRDILEGLPRVGRLS